MTQFHAPAPKYFGSLLFESVALDPVGCKSGCNRILRPGESRITATRGCKGVGTEGGAA